MRTEHRVINANASDMSEIKNESIALVVTSPPYPMIEMWDDCFCGQDARIIGDLQNGKGTFAFEWMHQILDRVWHEVDRVVIPGGIVCVNIGDATRTVNGMFQMFSNHSRIISTFHNMGYCVLPDVIWRKPSNSPNKFMGSGMYPAGAYVTYEHEYILIFRKGDKRAFTSDKKMRQGSAYFWEERNIWFSDLWDIKGIRQKVDKKTDRARSAAFPFEIPYRLINMYSIFGDTVLDPFAGTGTTMLAAMAAGRNSIGIDIEPTFVNYSISAMQKDPQVLNRYTETRLQAHQRFIETLSQAQQEKCYQNENYPFLVKTRQEVKAFFPIISESEPAENGVYCRYHPSAMRSASV